MWTLTLSTTISTSPSSIDRIIPRPRGSADRRIRPPMLTAILAISGADHEPADVGEEGHPATGLDHAQRGQAVDQLEDEPEAEDDDRRDVDELVEEAEEDQRRHPGAREEHEIRPQRRRDRPGGADRRDGRGRVDGDLGEARESATERDRSRGTRADRSDPRRCSRRSTGRACCPAGAPSRRAGTGWSPASRSRATGSRHEPRRRSGRPGRRPTR